MVGMLREGCRVGLLYFPIYYQHPDRSVDISQQSRTRCTGLEMR